RRHQRIDENRIGDQRPEVIERECTAAIDEAVIDEPRHRQDDQYAQQCGEQDQDRPREIDLVLSGDGQRGQCNGHDNSIIAESESAQRVGWAEARTEIKPSPSVRCSALPTLTKKALVYARGQRRMTGSSCGAPVCAPLPTLQSKSASAITP